MKLKTLRGILLLLTALLLTGCRSAPVYNVSEATYTPSKQEVTQTDVSRAIITAGQSLGWQMKEKDPGHILGTLYIRDHVAVVDVFYSLSEYSIVYNDSTNLKYDGTHIHSNYNGWVQNLSNAITTQVSNL